MTAASSDLVCDQGSTFDVTLIWQDANNAANETSDYNGRMDVRFAQTKEADLVIQLTQANGRVVRVAPTSSGKFQLLISAADTAALTAGVYYYDFEIFSVDGRDPVFVKRLVQGKFTVRPEVTG